MPWPIAVPRMTFSRLIALVSVCWMRSMSRLRSPAPMPICSASTSSSCTKMRACDSYELGNSATAIQPTRHRPQAMASASQRRCHTDHSAARRSSTISFMPLGAPSEEALGDDDHVARHEEDVGFSVAVLEQVAEAQREFLLRAAGLVEADQLGAVAAGELAEAADRNHRVEDGHVGAVGHRRRLLGRADDADLLAEGAG